MLDISIYHGTPPTIKEIEDEKSRLEKTPYEKLLSSGRFALIALITTVFAAFDFLVAFYRDKTLLPEPETFWLLFFIGLTVFLLIFSSLANLLYTKRIKGTFTSMSSDDVWLLNVSLDEVQSQGDLELIKGMIKDPVVSDYINRMPDERNYFIQAELAQIKSLKTKNEQKKIDEKTARLKKEIFEESSKA